MLSVTKPITGKFFNIECLVCEISDMPKITSGIIKISAHQIGNNKYDINTVKTMNKRWIRLEKGAVKEDSKPGIAPEEEQ